jgi:hypothetical protein
MPATAEAPGDLELIRVMVDDVTATEDELRRLLGLPVAADREDEAPTRHHP